MKDAGILVVEPDILVRNPLAEYLRECGYRVLEAASTEQARALVGADALRVDIVLADIDTPTEGAFALATWIRGVRPDVRVILAATTAKAAEEAGDLCEEGPALAKPYDHHLVLDRIRQLLAARDRARPADGR